jgi:hypothetical protein
MWARIWGSVGIFRTQRKKTLWNVALRDWKRVSFHTDRRLVPCCSAEGTGVTEPAGSQTVWCAALWRRRSHSDSSEPATKCRTEIVVADHESSKSLTSRFTNFKIHAAVSNTWPASLFYVACLGVEDMFRFKMFLWVWRVDGRVQHTAVLIVWTVGYSIQRYSIQHCYQYAVC